MSNRSGSTLDIRLYAVAASLLLSVYTIAWPHIPNDDAYTYVRTAEIFLQQGLQAAIAHYTWAAYSVLIALFSLTGLPLFTAALVINALCHALLVYAFVSIVQTLDDSRETVWLAALTVLVFPELNEYRYLIIRDTGYWALSVLGLWQFLLYFRDRRFSRGLLFCLALSLAVLLRAEAILYLLLTPLCLLLDGRRDSQRNRRDLWQIEATIAALGLAGCLLLQAAGIDLIVLMLELVAVYQPFLLDIIQPAEAAAIGEVLFGEYAAAFSDRYATAVIAVGLLVVLGMTVFHTISGPYFWLLVYGWWHRPWQRHNRQLLPVLAYVLINAVILLLFLYVTRYLSGRYAMLLALMVVTGVPFVVKRIIKRYRGTRWQTLAAGSLVLFFLFCAIDAYISFGKPRNWLLDAARYVNQHTDPAATVITNNPAIAWFSNRVENYDQVPRKLTECEILQAKPGDLVVVALSSQASVLVNGATVKPWLQPLAAFPPEQPQAVVYRRIDPPYQSSLTARLVTSTSCMTR